MRGLDPLFDPFCIWGNEMSMNISQVKKHRKIVRMKKLATNNSKILVCTMKKTSVNYRMVLTLLSCFYTLRYFKIYNNDLRITLCSVLFKHWCASVLYKRFLTPFRDGIWDRRQVSVGDRVSFPHDPETVGGMEQ